MADFIPLSVPNLSGNERAYVNEAIEAQWVSTGGSYITRFEEMVARFVGVPDAVACQSGTAALHLALICAGVQPGDEVIVPTLTFIAAVNPVKYLHAEPVFMDCDDSLCMDIVKLEAFLETGCDLTPSGLINRSSGRRVSAVIVVHVFGNLADMDRLASLREKYPIRIIEDATEALGSRFLSGRFGGFHAGTVGDFGAFSFNGNKIITTGGGGMLIGADSGELAHARYLSTQAKDDTLRFVHNEIGYNYRMTNVQAAIGVGQMELLPSFLETKKANYERYRSNGIDLLPFRDDIQSNYWFYSYMTERRDALLAYLADRQIQARPIWVLIHSLPPYRDAQAFRIERAPYYWERVVNIPCSTNLTTKEVDFVSESLRAFG